MSSSFSGTGHGHFQYHRPLVIDVLVVERLPERIACIQQVVFAVASTNRVVIDDCSIRWRWSLYRLLKPQAVQEFRSMSVVHFVGIAEASSDRFSWSLFPVGCGVGIYHGCFPLATDSIERKKTCEKKEKQP
jgi:hypothetical protein